MYSKAITKPFGIKFLLVIIVLATHAISVNSQKTNTTTSDSIKSKKPSVAAIPIINYDPSLGATIGAMGQYFYKINKKDTISPSSSTGLFGIYTTNKTYFMAAFQRFYLNEDRWKLMFAGGKGNINFQFWQDLPDNSGVFIDFNTEATFALARIERKLFKKPYGGINMVYSDATTTYDLPDYFPDSLKYDKVNMNNIGYLFNYDMREHQLNPYSGYNVEFKNNFYKEWINSSYDFNKTELTYNHYYTLSNTRNILATRFKANIATGNVPFQGQNVIGQEDIRGYSNGKHRDNQTYAMQAEYRWRYYKRVRMVGFIGIATAVSNASEILDSEFLPGAGVGFRYLMLPIERINIGIDVAKGKDDWGMYFRIGESFGR